MTENLGGEGCTRNKLTHYMHQLSHALSVSIKYALDAKNLAHICHSFGIYAIVQKGCLITVMQCRV